MPLHYTFRLLLTFGMCLCVEGSLIAGSLTLAASPQALFDPLRLAIELGSEVVVSAVESGR